MYDEAVDFADPMDCADASVAPFVIPTGRFFERKPPFPFTVTGILQGKSWLIRHTVNSRTSPRRPPHRQLHP